MDWLPFLLVFASGAFLVPMLLAFQKRIDELDKKIRTGEAQIRDSAENVKKFAQEKNHANKEIEKTKASLAEVDKEREVEEAKFRDLKKQLMSDGDDE